MRGRARPPDAITGSRATCSFPYAEYAERTRKGALFIYKKFEEVKP